MSYFLQLNRMSDPTEVTISFTRLYFLYIFTFIKALQRPFTLNCIESIAIGRQQFYTNRIVSPDVVASFSLQKQGSCSLKGDKHHKENILRVHLVSIH